MQLQTLMANTQFDHSRQVAKISGILAKGAGYSRSETELITQAAAFHDIGKSSIPKEILGKPGPLTAEEFEIVKTHTAIGHQQISDAIQILTVAAVMCRDHHEWMDGVGGYIGLKGENIHPYVRLVAAADVFDALYSRRAYKAPWSIGEIRAYFGEQAGRQFDAQIVALLLSLLDDILPLYAASLGEEETA